MDEDIGFDHGAVAGIRYIEAPAMLFCHFAHQVYGHWLMDCLPAILRLRRELLASGRRLLAPRLLPWQRASLERIGLGSLVEEIDDELVLARDLLFPSHIDTSAAGAPSATIAETFAALAAGCPATHAQEPRLVYVSRQNQGPKRKMINEDALVAALEGIGYRAARPERLSLDDQIGLFASAAAVIGPHGSGLANIGFCRPGCLVVDLLLSSVPDPWICRLSAVLGQSYAYHISRSEPMTRLDEGGNRVSNLSAQYSVDIGAVLALAAAVKQRVKEVHSRH